MFNVDCIFLVIVIETRMLILKILFIRIINDTPFSTVSIEILVEMIHPGNKKLIIGGS